MPATLTIRRPGTDRSSRRAVAAGLGAAARRLRWLADCFAGRFAAAPEIGALAARRGGQG